MKKPLPPPPEKTSIIDRVVAAIEIVFMGTIIVALIFVIIKTLK